MNSSRRKSLIGAALLMLLAFTGLASWAFASPVGAAPDDDYHLASIWCSLGERDKLCAEGDQDGERLVQERLIASACYAFDGTKSAACGISETSYVKTSRGNFLGSYPPIFYSTMGIFASTDVAVSTIVMRLFNAALFVGIVTALLAMLGQGRRGPLVWGTVVSLVPLGMFLIPSVNPSSWAVISISALWVTLIGYFEAERIGLRIGFATISVLLAIMGAGSRGDSAVYVSLSALLAGILSFRKSREWVKLALLPLGIIIIGAVFFLTSGQSAGMVAASPDTPTLTVASIVRSFTANLPHLQSLWVGNFGTWGLGWLDTPMPSVVWATMIAVYSALVFWGLSALKASKTIVLSITLLTLVAMPMYVYVREQITVGIGVQPRYVLPLMVLFAGLAVYGFKKDNLGLSRAQGALALLGVALANSAALHANLKRYVKGTDGGDNLNTNIEWWWSMPISPMAVWIIGSLSFALLLMGLFTMMYEKQTRREVRNEVQKFASVGQEHATPDGQPPVGRSQETKHN